MDVFAVEVSGTMDVYATEEARGRKTEDIIAALGSRDGGGLSSSYAKWLPTV